MGKVLVIGDTHFPFTCRKSIAEIIKQAKRIKPDAIIQVGDLYDMYCFSKYPKSLNIETPQREIFCGHKMAAEMWESLPKCKDRVQMLGNHDLRPFKRIIERIPELEGLTGLERFWTFPKVKAVYDAEFVFQGVMYLHGYRSKPMEHLKHNLMSTVIGHSHSPGNYYLPIYPKKLIWEANAGYAGDPNSRPMEYRPQNKITRWVKGYLVIEDGWPHFYPLGV